MSDLTLGLPAVTKRQPKGHAFQISDLILAQSWAASRDLAMLVRLDHGSDDEEYEEILEFRAGTGSRAHFIVWSDGAAVFVQCVDLLIKGALAGMPQHGAQLRFGGDDVIQLTVHGSLLI